jgi:hypothetical protein
VHCYLRPVPWLVFLVCCAYVLWEFVSWSRSVEGTPTESDSTRPKIWGSHSAEKICNPRQVNKKEW